MQTAMWVLVPSALVATGNLPLAEHWKVYLPAVLVSFLFMVPAVIMAEKHGRMKLVFNLSIGLLLLVQLGLYLFGSGLMPLALWLTLFFVAFNILEATQPSWISRVAPASSKGTALGIYNTLQSIGLFLGGALGGYIAKHYGAGMVNLFAALWPCSGCLLPQAWWRRRCVVARLRPQADQYFRDKESGMASLNKVILIGNLGADRKHATPLGRRNLQSPPGNHRNLEGPHQRRTQENTEWHRVVFFGKLAEIAGQYLRKGSQIYVEDGSRRENGRTRKGQDRYTTEIRGDEMKMLGSRQGMGGSDAPSRGGDAGDFDAPRVVVPRRRRLRASPPRRQVAAWAISTMTSLLKRTFKAESNGPGQCRVVQLHLAPLQRREVGVDGLACGTESRAAHPLALGSPQRCRALSGRLFRAQRCFLRRAAPECPRPDRVRQRSFPRARLLPARLASPTPTAAPVELAPVRHWHALPALRLPGVRLFRASSEAATDSSGCVATSGFDAVAAIVSVSSLAGSNVDSASTSCAAPSAAIPRRHPASSQQRPRRLRCRAAARLPAPEEIRVEPLESFS